MSISIEKKKQLVLALACVAVSMSMLMSWDWFNKEKYDDKFTSEDAAGEDVEDDFNVDAAFAHVGDTLCMIKSWYREEEEEEEESDDEFTSEDAHCEDVEDGVEVTSCRKRSNLALEGGNITLDNIDNGIEGSSHQKRGRCTSALQSNCSVRKKPRIGDLVKEKLKVMIQTIGKMNIAMVKRQQARISRRGNEHGRF